MYTKLVSIIITNYKKKNISKNNLQKKTTEEILFPKDIKLINKMIKIIKNKLLVKKEC